MNNIAGDDVKNNNTEDILNDPGLNDPDTPQRERSLPISFDDPQLQTELAAAILTDPQWAAFALNKIEPTDFIEKSHSAMLRTGLDHFRRFGKVAPVAVLRAEIKEQFKEDKTLPYYLASIETTIGTYAKGMETEEYLRWKITAFAKNRAAMRSFKKWMDAAKQGKQDLSKVLAELQAGIADAASAFESEDAGVFTVAELQDEADMVWQIADHFPKNGTVTVFGPSGVGKSFYALDMALSVASGMAFLGLHETHKGQVLYICSEGSYGLKYRVNSWMTAHGLTEIKGIVFSTTPHDLQDRADVDALLESTMRKLTQIDLVIVDTLSRNFGPGDPDKNADMQSYLAGVDYIRNQTGGTVVSIHHTGHTEAERERGAKCLRDYSDASIGLAPEGDDAIVVSCKKQKDAREFSAYIVRKKPEGKSLVLLADGSKADLKAKQHEAAKSTEESKLLEAIPVTSIWTEGIDAEMIAAKLSWSRTKASRMLLDALKLGVVQRDRDGGKNQPWYYYREALIN